MRSKYIGVNWKQRNLQYEIYGILNGTKVYIGSDKDERRAAIKYDIWGAQHGKKLNILKPKK